MDVKMLKMLKSFEYILYLYMHALLFGYLWVDKGLRNPTQWANLAFAMTFQSVIREACNP